MAMQNKPKTYPQHYNDHVMRLVLTHQLLTQQQLNTVLPLNQHSLINTLNEHTQIDSTKLAHVLAKEFHLPYCEPIEDQAHTDETYSLNQLIQQPYRLCHRSSDNINQMIIADPAYIDTSDEYPIDQTQSYSRLAIVSLTSFKTIYCQRLENALSEHKDSLDEASVSNFIKALHIIAIIRCASDIHIEITPKYGKIRLRCQGILHHLSSYPAAQHERILAQIKIRAHCNIAQHQTPQDGQYHFSTPWQQQRHCRLSTCPYHHGEKAVIRLMNNTQHTLELDTLGLNHSQLSMIQQQLQKPQGLILVTGPTGSGKTITLYTMLNQINATTKNICTVENPVEITLDDINQISIESHHKLTLSSALRTLLRQDPDVIMIGEIRDQETAQLATRAAMTGHLVIATLHANHCCGTLLRLQQLNIPVHELYHSLSLIIAQRLIRILCENCKKKIPHTTEPPIHPDITFDTYQAVGCRQCIHGYSHRTAMFELLPIHTLLQQNPSELDSEFLRQYMSKNNIPSLWQTGLDCLQKGETSIEELCRVIDAP